ncbi:MAG: hypothetical protein WBS54_02330 [Acidobacteriota bacterium]
MPRKEEYCRSSKRTPPEPPGISTTVRSTDAAAFFWAGGGAFTRVGGAAAPAAITNIPNVSVSPVAFKSRLFAMPVSFRMSRLAGRPPRTLL